MSPQSGLSHSHRAPSFGYIKDPLFLISCGLYLLNRFLLKPHFHSAFLHDYFNDLLLIPCALPPVLALQRLFRLRSNDYYPTFSEISFHLIIWGILFEGISPHLIHATSDPLDLIAYTVGGFCAWLFWKKHHPPSFNQIAPFYQFLTKLFAGEKIIDIQTTWLDQIKEAKEILIIGEGTGEFLLRALQTNTEAKIHVLDSSSRMLELARQKISTIPETSNRIEWIHTTLPNWQPPHENFDLIITHFVLDCFSESALKKIIPLLASSLKPRGLWLLSDFNIPSTGIARLRAQGILFLAYSFFKLTTNLHAHSLTSPDPLLLQNGLHLSLRKTSDFALFRSDLWEKSDLFSLGARLA